MPSVRIPLALLLAVGFLQDPAPPQEPVDPALRAAVDRFFLTQEAEDIDAYLGLWSTKASRPRPEMLKYVFDAGDDRFSDIQVTRVMSIGERVRVRVSARRERTSVSSRAGRAPVTRRTTMDVSLTFVREDEGWKLLREGPAIDDLAAALIEAGTEEERQRLLDAEPELLNERLVVALSRLAGEPAQKQQYAEAQVRYERMLETARRVGSRRYEGEALQNLGNAFYYQRNYPEALRAYEQRRAIERERGDDEALADAIGGIATIRYTAAEYSAALAAYRHALAIQECLNNPGAAATTLIATGNILYLQGDFSGAITDYTRSRELYRTTSNTLGEAHALEGLGNVYLARGDYTRALQAFARVLREGRTRGDRALQGRVALSLGDAHLRLGNLGVARSTFEESRDHFASMKDEANVGRAWQAIALTDLVAGRFAIAEEEYETSRTSCAAAGDHECAAGAATGLGFAQAAQEKFAAAISSYRDAIDGFTRLRRREHTARAQVGLSQALTGKGDYTLAIEAAADARHNAIALDNDDVLWRALVAEARALRSLEGAAIALPTARAAIAALDRQVDAARIRPANPVPRDTTEAFAALAVLQAEAGDAEAAFETAERLRVHELRLRLAGLEREIARGMTPAERDEERTVAVELVTLHAQLARERDLPKPDPERIWRLERSIADASARRGRQEQQLFERVPDLRLWRGLFPPATRADTDAVLGSGTMLLEFVVDKDDLLVLTARRGPGGVEYSAQVRPVSRKSLAEMVGALTRPQALEDLAEWRKAAAPLLDAVPELRPPHAAAALIVVPHEVLWRVPFEALPAGEGFLSDNLRVRDAQSVSSLLRLPAWEAPRAESSSAPGPGADRRGSRGCCVSDTLLVATAPELDEAVRARIAQVAPGWIVRPSVAALREADAVAGRAPAATIVRLAGADATEPAFRDRLPAADVIHVGAPFRVDAASPLFSPVLLAGDPGDESEDAEKDPREDASLDAREVMNLDLRARVAVLSDGAALSMWEAADEAVVIYWAWRAAGTRSLLIARWGEEAGASDDLLADFHARVRKGEAPEAALAAAQAAIRRSKGRAAPFSWAGWLLIGSR